MTRSCDNPKGLPPFATMRAFEAVGRLSGVRRAAQALNLDHAVVSRHIRTLEDWAGVRLLQRVEGKTVLTEDGARFHTRISAALAEISDASSELLFRNDEANLRICCSPGFALAWLTPRLSAFQATIPELHLELHPTDLGPDFSRYQADVDIRYVRGAQPISRLQATGVRAFEIASPPVFAVASPDFTARFAQIRTPADFLTAPLLHEENESQWLAWLSEQGVPVKGLSLPGLRLWHANLTLEAARRGQGIALANAFLVGEDLSSGQLVKVPWGSKVEPSLGTYAFFARADRWQSPAIVRFRLWLKETAPKTHRDTASPAMFVPLSQEAAATG